GFALCTYNGFNVRGFYIAAVFDNDPTKVGKKIGHLDVQPLVNFPEISKSENIRIGIIAVPVRGAQEVADMMISNGVEAILNFAPVALSVPEHVETRNVDLSVKLEILTFNLGFRSAQSL
ncbi:MAG: redox-sensing transcriptional repressor Rex, partial [Desulfotomaculaceae bacterium]